MNNIYIYGPPGSGKTTISKELSSILGRIYVDIDKEIEEKYSRTISEIISVNDEATFREYESQVILEFSLNRSLQVIALGGGALLRQQNRIACEKSGIIIFLDATQEVILRRISSDNSIRPLLAGETEKKISKLLLARESHYKSFELRVATYESRVDILDSVQYISDRDIKNICRDILNLLNIYQVSGMGPAYNVIVENGGLGKLGQYLRGQSFSGRTVVVMDDHLENIYRDEIAKSITDYGFDANFIIIPHGEDKKTLVTVSYLWKQFLLFGLDRSSMVISIGGGVVSDLTGFASSTFMRGCNWCAVPTSLLAMVDASIGGKTGFDTEDGKNLIGSFYPPKFVLVDPAFLSSLPEIEFRSGMAEVIKHGIINDIELFILCSKGYDYVRKNPDMIISKAIKVKVDTIVIDPFEKGIRAALNLGHTIGHAVEIASKFQLKHGEAIAIGMVLEAKLAEKLGLVSPDTNLSKLIESVLKLFSLPTEIPADLNRIDILKSMRFDKKKENGKIRFSLPVKIGEVRINISVDDMENVL